ncbi:MAG: hypothetical protein QOJ11_2670 [Frankiales bacterium]|jgi:uncharacterized membrane protein YgcG|nr:hypothetical protein [Frankiales bacterium]
MTYFDDDPDDMTPPSAADDLDDRRVEALLRGTTGSDEPRLTALLALARSLGEGPAPQPSPALAALLSSGSLTQEPSTADPRWRRRLATVALVSFGSSAALVGAAAANVLPSAAQTAVAEVVNHVTPLTLPGAHPVRPPAPDVERPAAPAATVESTRPTQVRPTEVSGPTGQPTPTPMRTPQPGVTSVPQPRHTPGLVGRPTGLPSQANSHADDHRKPSHTPAAKTSDGHQQSKSPGGSHDGSKTPKSNRPTPKPSHTTDGGSGTSSGGKSNGGKNNDGGKGSGGSHG